MPEYRIGKILLDGATDGDLFVALCLVHIKTGEEITASISRKAFDDWVEKINHAEADTKTVKASL